MPEITPLLTVSDLMEQLDMSRKGIYKLIKDGKLKPIYIDRRPKFDQQDVWEMIYAHRRNG